MVRIFIFMSFFQSEMIKDAIYDLPWESMDLKNRKIVLIFLSHAQTPITFKASGLISVGVRTMAEVSFYIIVLFIFKYVNNYVHILTTHGDIY